MKNKFLVLLLAGLFLVMFVSQGTAQKQKLDLKKIADNIIKVGSSGDPVAFCKLYAEDAVMIQSGEPGPVRGRAAIEKSTKVFYRAMPDMKMEVSSVRFFGDTIVFELIFHGTFTGPMTTPEGEVAPTGKSLNCRAAFFAKISPDGLIAEDRTYFDTMDFMKQLGLMK
jgi:steroid delta-isomerase-like uncharacterized protein